MEKDQIKINVKGRSIQSETDWECLIVGRINPLAEQTLQDDGNGKERKRKRKEREKKKKGTKMNSESARRGSLGNYLSTFLSAIFLCGTLPVVNRCLRSSGLNIWNEHMSVSSTDIMAPALSNSPQ